MNVDTHMDNYSLADLDVSPTKVSAELIRKKELKGLSMKELKEKVVAQALLVTASDVMVEPRFIILKRRGSVKSIQVTGYPATYKNFRNQTLK